MLEMERMIKVVKNNKSPGQDKVTTEFIKYGSEQIVRLIKNLIGGIWKQGDAENLE